MEIDLSEYKSPVQIIVNEMNTRLDGQILEAIQSVGVDVNKEELIKAMNYDREQYSNGFENGYNKAIYDFSRELSDKIMSEIDDCAEELQWIDEIAKRLKES